MNEQKIVANMSKGYGYNYASLQDIAKQGYKIPKMSIETDSATFKDYVTYYDEELKVWVRGAEVVVPENIINKEGKGKMNAAQLYGSALTYARRYTALMALQLVCGDDVGIENGEEVEEEDAIQSIQKQIITANFKLIVDELKAKGIKTAADIKKLSITEASELCNLINKRKETQNDSNS